MSEPRLEAVDRDIVISNVPWGYNEPDEDSLVTTDSIDYSDDTAVRDLVGSVDETLTIPQSLRLTFLNPEELQEQLDLRPHDRGHAWNDLCLLDHTDPFHLLVSPACVEAVNRADRQALAEVLYVAVTGVYARELQQLSPPLRNGLRNVLIEECGRTYGIEGLAKSAPFEAQLVRMLAQALALEPSFEWLGPDADPFVVELEWMQLLAVNPERFFLALRNSGFGACWLERVRQAADLGIGDGFDLITDAERPLERLCQMLWEPAATPTSELSKRSPLFGVTHKAALDYLEQLEERSL
jgi:hypothetical protein